ncbi:MAG TPA: cadherin domain-containing protein, partial [Gammaproteobacteria bacterium]|nr:cadherin domain-containing protein [Gammaproteobacteria bacterium]
MRAELVSLSGNGSNLSFSVIGEGDVVIDLKNPSGLSLNVTGATVKSLVGEILTLNIGAIGPHDVSVTLGSVATNRAPTITSNGGGDTATIGVAENTTAVATVTATDPDAGQTRSFSIVGGADQALFTISAGGVLSFVAPRNFESPADSDRNNSYVVQVRVADNGSPILSDTQTITVNVADVAEATPNQAPTYTVSDGKVTTMIGSPWNFANALAIQPDGNILVAGDATIGSSREFALARFNSNGSLDTTFDGDGKVTTSFGAGESFGNSVALRDGKIIVAGYSFSTAGTAEDFAVARYNANGTLDTTFDGDGRVTTDFGGNTDVGRSVAIQADGKILVAGESRIGSNYDFSVARYNANGTLDTTFDGDGRVRTDFGSDGDIAWTLAVQGDGKIVVGGWGGGGFTLARYNANGSLDTTFDGDGRVATIVGGPNTGFLRSIVIQPDGKILAAGEAFNGRADTDIVVLRYNANGTLDTSFGTGGIVFTNTPTVSDAANDLLLQPDGRIIVAGHVGAAAGSDFFLVRINADGTIDGAVTTDFGNVSEAAKAIERQADGKLVVAGFSYDSFAVARYNADGSLDPTFDPTKVNTLNGTPAYTAGGAPVVLDTDVRAYDPDLAASGNYSGATLTLARSAGANAQDVFSATGDLATLTQGAALVYDGVTVGTVTTNSAGRLLLTFNSSATQGYVDDVLQSIAYSNSSATPPASVQINWTFSDSNAGAQGTGGALMATGSTTVTISTPAPNQPPVITSNGGSDATSIAVTENSTAVTTVTATDPN